MRRSVLAASLCLCAVAVLPMSGCASAPAAEASPAARTDPSEPELDEDGGSYRPTSAAPVTAPDGPAAQDGTNTAPSDPWTDRPDGTAGPAPRDGLVRLRLPAAPLEPLLVERRPSLPARARLALVCARDARLVHDADALLSLGSELGSDQRLDPVVALGALAADVTEVDLDGLAEAAAAQGFDLLLIDVRAKNGGADREGLLVHAETAQVLGWFEVTDGRLPRTSDGGPIADGLVERVGEAYARAR